MRLHRPRSLATLIGLALSAPAWAEQSPYYIGANQAFGYRSNLFSSESDPMSSAMSITSLVFGLDQPIGRQRVYASGNVGYNYFFNPDARVLNNTSYSLSAGLDWATIERLSGTVRLLANQNLVYYAISGAAPDVKVRNIQNVAEASFDGRYGITPRVGLDLGYTYRTVSFSDPGYAYQEYDSNIGRVGFTYGGDGQLTVGLGLRFNWTDYPNYPQPLPSTALGDDSLGKNIDFTAKWIATGQSTLDVRLSMSDVSYTYNTINDFNGFNGSFGWTWTPTGKLWTRLVLNGEPSYTANFWGYAGSPLRINNSKFARSIRYTAIYQATGKTSFNANIRMTKDSLSQTDQITGNSQYGSDLYTTIGIGVTYAPTRNSQIACNLDYQRRSANDNAILYGMSYPYNGTNFQCSGQLVIQ